MLRVLAATTVLAGGASVALADGDRDFPTKTPIKHLVVIFQENVSFDHYFATYPVAANPDGEPHFRGRDDTPTVNGLNGALLTDNPNGANPIRLDRSQAVTCDNDHDYTDEQKSVDGGLLDKFTTLSCSGTIGLNYYDGNTVTAMWNYAQHFAMNDNSFGTTFGPSTPGALNLVSGQMHAIGQLKTINDAANDLAGDVTLSASTITGDADPLFDDCGAPDQAGFAAKAGADNHNIGDLLNAKHITWGWFQGGFTPTQPATFNPDGSVKTPAVCGATATGHPGVDPGNPSDPVHAPVASYSAHHNPFMYYDKDANTHHLPPTSEAMVGKTDRAKHQYDLSAFFDAIEDNRLPAVSFLKAARAEDGHPGNSDPLSEQLFVVDTINKLQRSPEWRETAVVIAWDDSDGWYDHVTGPIVNHSNVPGKDALTGSDCGTPVAGAYLGRCGYGPRLPLMLISPWAKRNFVDHTTTDQTSPLHFIENNWDVGRIDDLDHPDGTPDGQASFDTISGSLLNMFDFDDAPHLDPVILDRLSGQVDSD
jgi:phospholipase C